MKENSIEENIKKCKKTRLPEGEDYIFGKEAKNQMEDIKILKENEGLKKDKKECIFREDGTEECLWYCSNCNKEWLFYEGTPADNELKYCPHCGAKVIKYENHIEGEIEVANKMEQDLIEKLQKENEELKYKYNKAFSDIIAGVDLDNTYIPIQKVKDILEKEIKYHEKNILDIENVTLLKEKTIKEETEIEFNKYAIVVLAKALQELLEGRK